MNVVRRASGVDSTYGCLFLSGIFSSILWGGSCLQLYFYCEKYWKKDNIRLKAFVLLIWTLDAVHQIILMISLYTYFVTEFGDFDYIKRPQRLLFDEATFAAVINASVQFSFVLRAWHLSKKNIPLVLFLSSLVLAQLALTFAYFGEIYNFIDFRQLISVLTLERAMNATVVVADTIIAMALIYLLWKCRSGFKRTDSIIKRLVMYTISTGLVTGIWAAVALIGAQVQPESLIYLLVDLVIPKLYINGMLASLNARSGIHEMFSSDRGLVSIHLDNLPSNSSARRMGSNDDPQKSLGPFECRVDISAARSSLGQERYERSMSEVDLETGHASSSTMK